MKYISIRFIATIATIYTRRPAVMDRTFSSPPKTNHCDVTFDEYCEYLIIEFFCRVLWQEINFFSYKPHSDRHIIVTTVCSIRWTHTLTLLLTTSEIQATLAVYKLCVSEGEWNSIVSS